MVNTQHSTENTQQSTSFYRHGILLRSTRMAAENGKEMRNGKGLNLREPLQISIWAVLRRCHCQNYNWCAKVQTAQNAMTIQ